MTVASRLRQPVGHRSTAGHRQDSLDIATREPASDSLEGRYFSRELSLLQWYERVLAAVKEHLLVLQLQDSTRARMLCADGGYRAPFDDGAPRVDAQEGWVEHGRSFLG